MEGSATTDATTTSGTALAVRGLVKAYGDFRAVDGIDLSVDAGQAYGLLGPNGCGKTTTLSCALGLLPVTSGGSRVLGVEADQLHLTRGALACVFDAPALLTGHTVGQNLRYLRMLRGHDEGLSETEALGRVGLEGFERRRAGELSLGQRRRLTLAGALAGEPKLIVLDEPLSGLDPMGVRDMLALLHELQQQGTTLIVSSHRLHEMEQILTHLAILVRGRKLYEGTLDGLLGHRDAVLARVDDHRRAAAMFADGLTAEVTPDGELAVRGAGVDAAEVNRRLVEGGVAVRELRPARLGLQAAFEALVDANDPPEDRP